MLLALLLQFALLTESRAEDRLPPDCKHVPQYDQVVSKYGATTAHTKACREAIGTIMNTWQWMKTAKSKAPRGATIGNSDSQAASLQNAAAIGEAGAVTTETYSQIAAKAKIQFSGVQEKLEARIKQLEREANVILGNTAVSAPLKAEFRQASADALSDFKKLHATARGLVAEAGKVSGEYQEEATLLNDNARRTRDSAERLDGGNQQPPPKEGVSNNMMFGIGGAALIAAGTIGGLYWVSQKAIKSTDKAAAARIAQAETTANNVIKNAEEAAKRIITFATNSVNQIIANAEEAANRIYDRAKSDVDKLITDLRKEIQETFVNLTETGLRKLRTEMESMFNSLIARAKAAGDKVLEENLKKAWDSINGQISSEIASRQGTSTSTGTGTGTGTGTSTGTSTSTGTGTSSGTTTATSTASNSTTQTSTSTSIGTGTYTRADKYRGGLPIETETYTHNR